MENMCYFRHDSINIKDKTTRAVQLYWGEQVVSSAVVAISFQLSLFLVLGKPFHEKKNA